MAKEVSWQSGVLFGDPIGAPKIDASFDYIVVGGGTSGLAVAARLAEDPSVTVAVVEAGGNYNRFPLSSYTDFERLLRT